MLQHMTLSLQPILEKGIVDHSIVHRALVEYLSVSKQVLWEHFCCYSFSFAFFLPVHYRVKADSSNCFEYGRLVSAEYG
jgi:hypothetical protein